MAKLSGKKCYWAQNNTITDHTAHVEKHGSHSHNKHISEHVRTAHVKKYWLTLTHWMKVE